MWVYIESEPGVFTVGFWRASDVWMPESDHTSLDEAVARMRYLNGGPDPSPPKRAKPAAASPAAAPKK